MDLRDEVAVFQGHERGGKVFYSEWRQADNCPELAENLVHGHQLEDVLLSYAEIIRAGGQMELGDVGIILTPEWNRGEGISVINNWFNLYITLRLHIITVILHITFIRIGALVIIINVVIILLLEVTAIMISSIIVRIVPLQLRLLGARCSSPLLLDSRSDTARSAASRSGIPPHTGTPTFGSLGRLLGRAGSRFCSSSIPRGRPGRTLPGVRGTESTARSGGSLLVLGRPFPGRPRGCLLLQLQQFWRKGLFPCAACRHFGAT